MPTTKEAPSAREQELLERAYAYSLTHGLGDLSLRPLATAIGSSPRVLLFLFGSKDGLIRALLARGRADQLELLRRTEQQYDEPPGLTVVARELWTWLAAPERRPLMTFWVEAYGRSLVAPEGPWADFARSTVDDWLELLKTSAPEETEARRTGVLAMLRGALIDLLATNDLARTTAALDDYLAADG
ncbi:TetR/AcrR family transcriptional regulator [Kribbella solani]|uniref:TetR/AcrR family transcriptional regulator n=1 Tax=Kribbella solani TaxID=236067 RepID=UPI0029B2F476|nr:TetR/AcrR family transcriptional regulator [Kribbella solani]MDX2972323.1 TetR/AcrR family transcriptional regulator [Kribbella solani]MDX3003342.1 TetR/AcrR family transcriptional regulator [Kribbella solani]